MNAPGSQYMPHIHSAASMGVTPVGLEGLQPPEFEVRVANVLQPPRISSGHRCTTMTTPDCLTQSYANGCKLISYILYIFVDDFFPAVVLLCT
jgi:hypothetical protein